MRRLLSGPRWAWNKLRNLRALVRDEDHDPWYDDHSGGQEKSPNIGPNLGGGAT